MQISEFDFYKEYKILDIKISSYTTKGAAAYSVLEHIGIILPTL